MRVVAIGTRTFVSGFQLAGVSGIRASSHEDALREVSRSLEEKDVGLILVSDDVATLIRSELTEIRTKRPVPLIYEIPAPGSRRETFGYRDMLRQILGV